MHIRFDLWGSPQGQHAQDVMRQIGITYQYAVPQSIADQWWFWNCENVPEPLPKYMTVLNVKPHEAIGYGLTKEMADEIVAFSNA